MTPHIIFSSQIQLKDLLRTGSVRTGLKGNSLMELMKLKPPPDIATPVATATATGQGELFKPTVRLVCGNMFTMVDTHTPTLTYTDTLYD